MPRYPSSPNRPACRSLRSCNRAGLRCGASSRKDAFKGETVTIERRFRANVADTSSGNGGSILTVGAADGIRPAHKKARRFHRALACIIPDYFGMSPSMPSTKKPMPARVPSSARSPSASQTEPSCLFSGPVKGA